MLNIGKSIYYRQYIFCERYKKNVMQLCKELAKLCKEIPSIIKQRRQRQKFYNENLPDQDLMTDRQKTRP